MADMRASLIWQDASGLMRQTVITTLAGSSAIRSALAGTTNAAFHTYWESALAALSGAAVNANYQSVKIAASLTYTTASGSILRLTIPSPSLSIFLPDKVTIDPSNASIVALNAAVIGSLSDGSGNAAIGYLGGTVQPARNDLPAV